ncbi:efflux transporter outer membrane subunit [Membranihabitans maritimus]|uniref:efflux transporter outer membrane subunit n=1 Tax=Membranihabitans maritimus TaxID=2904244 RepID=UPI001F271911|nr:TolC family protein [Membranihabitans maritimus]
MTKQLLLPILSLTIVIFQGCKVTRDYVQGEPESVVETFPFDTLNIDTVSMAAMDIEEFYNDPLLISLIRSGLENNYNLSIALRSIEIANAYYLQGKQAYWPEINASFQPSFSRNSTNSRFGSFLGDQIFQSYQLGVSASWEADIWGKLRAQEKAAFADYLAAESSVKVVQTELIANIASLYYQLVALDAQKELTERTIENRKASIETIESLKDAGNVTEVAVQQTEAQLYNAQGLIVDLNKNIQLAENTLNQLLGRTHQPVARIALAETNFPELLEVGVPSALLQNRPDLRVAEYDIRSAFEMTNVAETFFYPTLRITAGTGFETLDLGTLLSPGSIFGNLAAGLTQPIVSRRVNKTRREVSELQYQQAVLNYEDRFVNAVKEVSDAMYNIEAAENKIVFQQRELESLNKATEYSEELLNYGLANYLEVLRARDQALAAELSIITSHLNKLSGLVSLYKALGGGW